MDSIEPQPKVIPNSTNEGIKVVDYEMLETDRGLRPPISSYHPNIQHEVRKAYPKIGLHQPPSNFFYPWSDHGKQRRRFLRIGLICMIGFSIVNLRT